MERIFTRDVGRFKKGEARDWPWNTWTQFGDPASFSTTAGELASSLTVARPIPSTTLLADSSPVRRGRPVGSKNKREKVDARQTA
jgi:hypothetical protein